MMLELSQRVRGLLGLLEGIRTHQHHHHLADSASCVCASQRDRSVCGTLEAELHRSTDPFWSAADGAAVGVENS